MSLKIKPMPKSRKEVFQYFSLIESFGPNSFKCNLCNLILRKTFIASALRAHLNKYHPIVLKFRDSYQSFNENKALINLNNNLHYSDFNLTQSPEDNSQENEVKFLHSADVNCFDSSEENNKGNEDSNVQGVYTNCSQSSNGNRDNNPHCVDTNSLRTSKDSNKENNYNQRLGDTNEPQSSDINNPSNSETNTWECSVINEIFPLNLDELNTFESRELQQPRSEETQVAKMLTNIPLSLKDPQDTESIVDDKSVDPTITSSSSLLADSPKKKGIPKVILTSVSGNEESRYETSTLTRENKNVNRWTIRFKENEGEASALTKVYRAFDDHHNNLDKYKSANEPENACSEMNATSSDANIIENEEIVSDVTKCRSDEESNITSSIVNYPEKLFSSKRDSNNDIIRRTVSGFIDNFCLTLSASGTLLSGSFLLMEKDDVVLSNVLVSSRKQLRKFLKTLKPYEIIFKFENSQSNIVNTCLGMQCTNKKLKSSLYIMFCLFKNNSKHLQYYVYTSTQRNIFYVMMHQLIRGDQLPRSITDVIENYLIPIDFSRLRSMTELKNLSSLAYCDNLDPFV